MIYKPKVDVINPVTVGSKIPTYEPLCLQSVQHSRYSDSRSKLNKILTRIRGFQSGEVE